MDEDILRIVIPLHPRGGKLRDDSELKATLRSIEAHVKVPYEVAIAGSKLPVWSQGLRLIEAGGLKSALVAAAAAFPAGFLWWYDDCVLLRDATPADLKVTPCSRKWSKPRTGWARKLDSIRQRLEAEGRKAWDYSRPHGPYWFDKAMVDEGFADWPGMAAKFPWESWILSKRDWPRRHGAVKQYYGPFRGGPSGSVWFLNYNDRGFSPELRGWLGKRFERPGRHEAGTAEVAWPTARATVEVHTIRYGASWWLAACSRTLDAWCRKWEHPLRVWGKDEIDPAYPAEKFCQVDMLREFLQGDAEWLLYVDADVYVHPTAPPHPDFAGRAGCLIRPDRPSKFSRHWPRWCRARFGEGAREVVRGAVYRNAGVWACDRAAAEALLAVVAEPYHACVQEQHHWNWWLARAAKEGMALGDLPEGWNAWPSEDGRAAFFHLCGRKKSVKFNRLLGAGLIPREEQSIYMTSFNFDKYRFAHCGTNMPMDELHIHLLHLAAGLETGKPGAEKIAVEIGSYQGASTAALVEALNQGKIGHLHVVEVKPTAPLLRVLGLVEDPRKFTLHQKPYWETDIGPADIVFIDGDHKWPAVGDTLRAVTWGAGIIAMHDSNAYAYPEYSGTWGAKLGADCLKSMAGRTVFEDAVDRPGARTKRGFLVSAVAGIDLGPLGDFVKLACGEDGDAG